MFCHLPSYCLLLDLHSYTKAAGARVVPILYHWSDAEIKKVFKIVNGIFFTGGNYPLRDTTQWYHAGELLFNLAMEENKKGVLFPVRFKDTATDMDVKEDLQKRSVHYSSLPYSSKLPVMIVAP